MHDVAELTDIAEAIDLARKVDFDELDPGARAEAVVTIERLKAKLAGLGAAVTRSWEQTHEWTTEGHRTAKVALRHRARLHGGDAHRSIALARTLRSMPATTALLDEGRISQRHAERLARASSKDRFAEAERLLCVHALELSFKDFDRAVTYWEDLVDPDGADSKAAHLTESRRAHSSKTLAGMGRVDAWLDPIGFATFDEALRRIEKELFEEDWSLAREEYGPDAGVEQLGRTPAQRRAEAMVEMARRSTAMPDDAKKPEPLVIVHTDAATFEAAVASLANDTSPNDAVPSDIAGDDPSLSDGAPTDRLCELDDGTPITPDEMLEQAILGHVRRIVFGGDGVILDFGRERRLFSGALRLAVQTRDRQCVHSGCEIPARRCEIDHEVEWQHGGRTSHANGKVRCSFHHRHHKPGR